MKLERAVRWLLEALVVALLSAIALVCFVEVVLRYGLGASFGWYDEFTGYLLVWLTFLGAVLAQTEERHIGVENVLDRLSPEGRRWARIVAHTIFALLHVLLLYYGSVLSFRFFGDRAITLPVPMGLLYLVIPLSALLMLVVQGFQIGRLLRQPPPHRSG